MVFPGNRVGGKPTLNAARGFNRKISDRMDLTLECVRRYYRHQDSPLARTPRREGNPPARALSRSSVTNQIPAWPILIVHLADDITRIRRERA